MNVKLFSVFDKAAGVYGRPFAAAAIGMARRTFVDEVNRASTDNPLYQHPSDFELWYVCDFNEESGYVILKDPELLMMGSAAADLR